MIMKTINVRDYWLLNSNGSGLFVSTYKKYNEGSLDGSWIDLSKCDCAEHFLNVCRELHSDESDPEFMFQDYQGFPEILYSESMSKEQIEHAIEFAKLNDDDKEMVEDYCDHFSQYADVETVRGACYGRHDDFVEFASELADDMLDNNNTPACIRMYFDYNAYARDLEINDYFHGNNGFIFNRHIKP